MSDPRQFDDRPRPKYGEYAPVTPLSQLPPPAAPAPAVEPTRVEAVGAEATAELEARRSRRRTRDIIITTALLLFGVYDVVISLSGFTSLGNSLRAAFEQQGVEGFASAELAAEMGATINVVRVVLLAIAIVVSLLLIARGKLAFWVPLAAGVASAITVIVCVLVVVISDPGFAAYVAEQTTNN